ncbi:hypothetical protein F0562_031345 [Nyssa sinensis]|uniref:RRM domain-containing protein n=1 Tax=Nyssa sinensis TaxID=561372 RepID=A0A5J5ATZ4_9ASTE|nr:hypothetical protein F0562_031345 [Nyssa sinensis]
MEGLENKNNNASVGDVMQEDDNVAEEQGMGGGQNESGRVGNDGFLLSIVPVAEQKSVEEETSAAQINNTHALGDNNNVHTVNEGSDGEVEGEESGNGEKDNNDTEEDSEVDNEDDNDATVFIHDSLTDRMKQKNIEIFIGRLDKGAVEDDLTEVFGKFGEIKAARIVRNPTNNKSKGFAFIRYATVEQAKNALSVLKDGIEVRGKHVKISASQDNDTLYMGNICKTWTKEHVLGTLKLYGIGHVEEIHLPDDPKNEGKIKGFALLEFSTHSDAMEAFQRLRKPDAVFGRDRSAKVAFAQTPMHPSEDVLSQVKTVYVEGLTDAWNEEKVKEICKQYGEIVKVKLSQSLGTKRKDFGFITFTSRGSALTCMEGINNAYLGDGEVKVKASIAKPQFKGRLQKQGFRGGFKVGKKSEDAPSEKGSESTKQAGPSKRKGHAKSKEAKRKGKAVAEEKGKTPELKIVGGGKVDELCVTEGQIVGTSSNLESRNRKRKKLPIKPDGHEKRGVEHGYSKKPSKKSRGNKRRRQNSNFRNPKRDPHIRKGPDYGADSYTPGYAASTANYHGHARGAISGSKRSYTDMEPHAGYLEPVSGKQHRPYSGYLEPAVGTRGQPHAGYLQPAVGTQGQPHAGYLQPGVGTQGQPHAGYLQPAVGTQGRPHSGYLQPAVGTQGRPHSGYLQPAVGTRGQPHSGYLQLAVGTQGRLHAGYLEPSAGTQGQPNSGYHEPAVGTHGRPYAGYIEANVRTQHQSQVGCLELAIVTQSRPHAGYLESAAGKHGHDPHDPRLRRTAGHDAQSSGVSAYGGGSALPPSYVPSHTSYAGYEGGASVSGYYQSGGVYVARSAYY